MFETNVKLLAFRRGKMLTFGTCHIPKEKK